MENSNVSNLDYRTTEEELKLELIALTNLKAERLEQSEEHKRRVDFTSGVALGLIYGVIGNLVVQHYYGVFEGLETGVIDNLFWSNAAVFVIGIVVIIVITLYFIKEIKREKNKAKKAKDDSEVFRKAIQKRELLLERKTEKT
jgi:hypothetical protein